MVNNYMLLFVMVTVNTSVVTCPMRIVNDGMDPIFVTDIHSKQALYLAPGNSGVIDPGVHGLFKWFGKEHLRIYVPGIEKNVFHGTYELTEHRCVKHETTITFSQVKEWVHTPSKRFSARFEEYVAPKPPAH